MRFMGLGRAFSLLEMLVTIALLVVVAAILAPVIGQAREASRSALCMANLEDQGVLVSLYTYDNDGHLPPWDRISARPTGLPKRLFYDQILEETVQSIKPRDFEKASWLTVSSSGPVGIFTCPSVRTAAGTRPLVYAPLERPEADNGPPTVPELRAHSGYSHYEVNDYLLAAHHEDEAHGPARIIRPDPATPERKHTNLRFDDLESADSRLMIKDAKVWRTGARLGVAASISRFKEHSMHNEYVDGMEVPGLPRPVVVHAAGMNALYADGHVRMESAERNHWENPINPTTSRTRYGNVVLGY